MLMRQCLTQMPDVQFNLKTSFTNSLVKFWDALLYLYFSISISACLNKNHLLQNKFNKSSYFIEEETL